MTRTRFFGYASQPSLLGEAIETASRQVANRLIKHSIVTWPQVFTYGEFIDTNILGAIDGSELCYFDISVPNFNVFFEAGYSIGRGKPTICLVNKSLVNAGTYLTEIGLFDTIGLGHYTNSGELIDILIVDQPPRPILPTSYTANYAQPLFVVKSRMLSEGLARALSSLTDTSTQFRSFDAGEESRMALRETIQQVAESTGILCAILSNQLVDSEYHNLRSAFVAGLARAMDRELIILNMTGSPLPLDLRDYAKQGSSLDKVQTDVQAFALRSLARLQRASPEPTRLRDVPMQRISMGGTAAENESRRLSEYFVNTPAYRAAFEGEGRVVIGRKGSGKTAIFMQMAKDLSQGRSNLTVAIKPEGYQLRKFKDSLVRLLAEGTKEHTIAAFWEYLLLLEICHQCITNDRKYLGRDPDITRLLPVLENSYGGDDLVQEGDFSERTMILLNQIEQRFKGIGSLDGIVTYLSRAQITELVYSHDINSLRSDVVSYLQTKARVVILVDNLDKGWEANGVSADDILMLRTLIEVGRKLERNLTKGGLSSFCLLFLRNDVYELLLDETPDRGKEGKVTIDWTDRDLLKQVVKRRLTTNDGKSIAWGHVAVAHVEGLASLDWLISRSLMRPRYLIDLISRCLGAAASRNHDMIQEIDFQAGYNAFSLDAVVNTNLEIRDVEPTFYDSIFALQGQPAMLSRITISLALLARGFAEETHNRIVNTFIWYGLLGVSDGQESATYIYDVEYNGHVLDQTRIDRGKDGEYFEINRAFWPALKIKKVIESAAQITLL